MDADLLEELYRKYHRGALLYCTALCGDPYLAQDIAAEAFVKAYLSLPGDIPSFRYWLLRVCKNLWYDHLRSEKQMTVTELPPALTDGSTPESSYIRKEQLQFLWRAIARLSPMDRELLTLYYFSDVPLQEAARLLGKSYPAVRQRIQRLRQTLKQEMEEQGYGRDV